MPRYSLAYERGEDGFHPLIDVAIQTAFERLDEAGLGLYPQVESSKPILQLTRIHSSKRLVPSNP